MKKEEVTELPKGFDGGLEPEEVSKCEHCDCSDEPLDADDIEFLDRVSKKFKEKLAEKLKEVKKDD